VEAVGSVGLEDRRGGRAVTQPSRIPEEALISQLEREKRDLQMENDLLKKVRNWKGGIIIFNTSSL